MHVPRTITSPVTGGRVTFLELPEETDGEYLTFEITADPQVRGPPMHIHPKSAEQFEVREGSLYVTIDGDCQVVGAHESVVVPARTPHSFRVGPAGVRAIGTVTPPGRFAEFLTTEYALMHAGKLGEGTDGDLLAIAPWIREFRDVTRPVGPIRYLLRALAPLGRALGYPAIPEYPIETVAERVESTRNTTSEPTGDPGESAA